MNRHRAALPGDRISASAVERMIRVDHAGEYGAKRIYAGQLAVLRRSASAPVLQEMAAQEQQHLDAFAELAGQRRVRPTALLPLWHVAGFALGAATAALGQRAAMACTVAIEETIDAHYAAQIEALDQTEAELRGQIEHFRNQELHHRDAALARGARQAPAYRLLYTAIKTGCRLAIAASERL